MFGTMRLAPFMGLPWVRKFADTGFVQVAHRRVKQLDELKIEACQSQTLLRMVRLAEKTKFGRDHGFESIRTCEDYQHQVPIRDYDDFWRDYLSDIYPRLRGVTWPDFVPYYALSSGTTTGSTKYIPISRQMVKSNQRAAFTTSALFRHGNPSARIFTGKFFFLGGSTELRKQDDGSLAGDLSGIAAKEVAGFLRPYCFPPLELALISDWETKLQKLAEHAIRERITAVSGVPSWMKILFDRVKLISGKSTIAEVWPDLRLIVHGGTKFDPYRDVFIQDIGSSKVKFCEVYPCSEGFIATEDPRYKMLRILPDNDIFFEFVPVSELTDGKFPKNPTRHTLANVEIGEQYAVIMTTCAGLWSYNVGDTVLFESRNPPLIRFTGRTKYFLSAFGEHLIQEEIDKAIAFAAQKCGVMTIDHHVGPVFPKSSGEIGYHLYFVEFSGQPPHDMNRFVDCLDTELSRINEDYAAHRIGDLTMLKPQIRVVPKGGFAQWMKSRGKFGGQNKVPRMDNSGELTQSLAVWLQQNYQS